jgi:hypothetical protein
MRGASLAAVSLVPMSGIGRAALPRRSVLEGRSLEPGDPAVHALTDFAREFPVTVDPERQIDDALNDMIHLGVKSCTRWTGGASNPPVRATCSRSSRQPA